MAAILNFWITVLVQALDWFTSLLRASHMMDLYLVMFIMLACYRLLVVPIVGQAAGAGSDKVKRKKDRD